VIERPAEAVTAREQSRWELPVISWMAAEAAAPGGGLAVLLDGPQGVSATAQVLGISLLRAPTWPDPSADNGWQRLRLGLAPCPAGWRSAAVPQLAQGFREPLWCRPLPPQAQDAGHPDGDGSPLLTLPPLGPDLLLLGLRPCGGDDGQRAAAVISVQNLSSCRQRLQLDRRWRLLQRLDGLDQPLVGGWADGDGPSQVNPVLQPWSIGFWRIAPVSF